MDIRLKEIPFSFDGQDWTLRCNMNVLADVQEENGGDFSSLLSGRRTAKSVLQLLAAMLNDDACARGRAAHYTARELGRQLSMRQFREVSVSVMELLILAVQADEAEAADEKNALTSEA